MVRGAELGVDQADSDAAGGDHRELDS
jgi:hypothetical protein